MDLTNQIKAAKAALIALGINPDFSRQALTALVVAQSLNRIAGALEAGGGVQELPAPPATPAVREVAPKGDWITDRAPDKGDADGQGCVRVRARDFRVDLLIQWVYVHPGTPWRPI